MKRSLACKTIFLFVITLYFFACESQKAETITSESPDGKIKITVDGQKVPLEPWKVALRVQSEQHANFDETLNFEFHADKLNEETVQFSWRDNNSCSINFLQQDGSRRTLDLSASRNSLTLTER